MKPCVVDTNVPIVANGSPDSDTAKQPTIDCRLKAVEFLRIAINFRCVLLDVEGEIQDEYRRYLQARGQPGVGDQFYRHVLNSAPGRVERRTLPRRADGEYADLPQALIDCKFDTSDRKFAALAKRENAEVANATDSDWIEHAATLASTAIVVQNLCGCEKSKWFEA
jgi:hypothetical protein